MENKIIYMKDDSGVLYRINGYDNEIFSVREKKWKHWDDDDVFFYKNGVTFIDEDEANRTIKEYCKKA